MNPASPFRVVVLPGDGLVARVGDGVLVADADPSHGHLVDALLERLRELCSDPSERFPGDSLSTEVARARHDHATDAVPPFLALAPGRAGAIVALGPGVRMEWGTGDRMETSSATPEPRDQVVPWEAGHVTLALATSAGGAPPDARGDLVAGVVPGAAAVIDWQEPTNEMPAVEVSAPAEVLPEPELRPGPFEVIDLGAPSDAEPREPLPVATRDEPLPRASLSVSAPELEAPLVDGIRCVNNHFNHPQARYCNVCGLNFQQQTVNVVKGPRPPLGILIFEDGSAYTLDTDYIIGREPELDPDVVARRARPLALPDPQRYIGRIHAQIRLEEWDVVLTDRGSANGTFVYAPGAAGWARLTAGQPVVVSTGAYVAIGPRTFVFESHHVQAQA